MTKEEKLNQLYEEYKKKFDGKEIVLGDGNINSRVLLVGEAPGKDEVRLSKPFVGAAGKNLSEFLEILNIGRESIYITNAIKYRLSKINPQTGRTVNRPATREEIKLNREYLLREICIIRPEYVVTLGNVPLKSILSDSNISIGDVHGKLMTVSIQTVTPSKEECKIDNQKGTPLEVSLFPLYHPASVIYNQSLKDIYYEDIQKLKKILESQKSRNGK
ncbi:MAG TPA: uracil-DNA glycosylase [Clostridiaceae bacterium]|nr:uracil-DNA glycosylase [Clostridiaceae bacterium]